MNNELLIKENEGIDSREVAEMMERSHGDVMKMIQGSGKNLGIVPVLEKGGIDVNDFFIKSTYKVEGNNKTYNCYLVTKKGCELLGSRLQGEKRLAFKLKYANNIDNVKSAFEIANNEIFERKEITFLNKLEQALKPFNITGIRQYKVFNYRIDYYIPSLKIAIEYDENNHKQYTYEQHEGRQMEIENELGCKFIRVSDKESDEYNIGLVIKELINNIYKVA